MYVLFALCSESHSVIFDSLKFHGLYCPWNSPGQNTGVGSLSLLQGIFPIEGLNPGLPHSRLLLVDPKGTPLLVLSTHKKQNKWKYNIPEDDHYNDKKWPVDNCFYMFHRRLLSYQKKKKKQIIKAQRFSILFRLLSG